nr:hypothetical protein [Tanacetum cinerariifolium]
APVRAFGEPFMRYSIPCKVDGQRAWDVELNLANSENYVTEEVSENMGFVYVNFSDYGRKMVNDVNVEIHGVKFNVDFVVSDYVNEEEPSIVFGRYFWVIDLTEEVRSSSGEVVKMGKAMEAYFILFKNVIMFKKLVDLLGSLPVQLKNLDWGNEGYGSYKKVDGDGDWHARFEIVTHSGRKFNRAFKTKTTTRKLSGKFKTEDVLRWSVPGGYEGSVLEDEVEHHLFEIYFGNLEVDDNQFDLKDYWTRVGTKENNVICASHYVTRIVSFLGYCVDDEIKKCSEPIDCKYWTSRMLADELDEENTCLKKEAVIPTQAVEGSSGQRQEHEGNQSNQGRSYGLGGDDYFTSAMLDFRGSSSGYAVEGAYEDEFKGKTTTLGVTLITEIGGLWRATSPNL